VGSMKSSWDKDTQNTLVEQLLEIQYSDHAAQKCDRQPFSAVDRQPDVMILDESGAASEYGYLLQPNEVRATFFESFSTDELSELTFYVPLDDVERGAKIAPSVDSSRWIGYRLRCGQLQVFDEN